MPRSEEQSNPEKIHPTVIQSSIDMMEIIEDDETPVKSLKILAQICVDELKKCNENEMQTTTVDTENNESIYISSDSDSGSNTSIRSSQRGVITGGVRKSSASESESSCESESESSSSSNSSSSDDSDSDEFDVQDEKKSNQLEKSTEDAKIHHKTTSQNDVVQQIVDDWTVDMESDETPLSVEDCGNSNENNHLKSIDEQPNDDVYNPSSLKDICKEVLQANSMIIRYDVPTLKYLCEHTLASNGMEIPLICFVPDESYEYISTGQPSNDENVYLCLDSEFDETELANLFNGAGNGVYESVEFDSVETEENTIDKASLIDQCVALQNILSSPPPVDHQLGAPIEILSDDTTFYMDANGFHDSIQYEETVLPSENSVENPTAAKASLKKMLQNKYVHPSIYHKMFAINKLLRKYKVYQDFCTTKKPIVKKRLQKTLSKLNQRSKEKRKPKKLATRRSARIADKIKQQKHDEPDWNVIEKPIKLTETIKVVKNYANKLEAGENRRICKIMNVNDIIQNVSSKKIINSVADKESITRDILKLIAKKRTLKRKLSICHRPNFNFDEDGYCYDEDGQISEMLSSFINTGFDEKKSESFGMKKPRSRRTSVEGKCTKDQDTKKKKISNSKKQSTSEDKIKIKIKKLRSKENNTKGDNLKYTIADSQENVVTEATAVKKTEKKNTMLKKIHNVPTKIHIKDVKEIIPAKRTRFLSIDGSLMKYGAERKKDNQARPFKQNSESPEIGKRKIPHQKFKRVQDKVMKLHENIKCKNSIEPNVLECTQVKENAEWKGLQHIKPKKAPKEPTIAKDDLSLFEKSTRKTKTPITTVATSFAIQKDNTIDTVKNNHTHLSCAPVKNRASSTVKSSPPPPKNSHSEKDHSDNRISSTESIVPKSNIKKQSKKEQETHLLGRNLCSTMLSPLKIIIEPKRISEATSRDRIIQKDPLAIDIKYQLSPEIIESPINKPSNTRKDLGKPTRFSERITNQAEKFLGADINTVGKLLPLQNASSNIVSVNKGPASDQAMTVKTSEEAFASIKPYLDIETLLPASRIPQHRPAKRCLSRAQTISHTESPFSKIASEPMKLRSSNNFWNRNTSSPNNYNSNQFNMNFSHKSVTPYTIPKLKQSLTPIQSPKISNASTQLQKTPIDVSSFPHPESLQIPSIDLKSTCSIGSPLLLPISMSIPMPVSMPIPVPLPLQIPMPVASPIKFRQTVTGNREVIKGKFFLDNIYIN